MMITALILYVFLMCSIWGRYWGGWENRLPHVFKLVMTFVIGATIAFAVGLNSWLAIVLPLVVLAAFLNPEHAYGQRMGFDGPPLWECIFVMSVSYGVYTLLASMIWAIGVHSYWPLVYALSGFTAPIGYLIGWYVLVPVLGIDDQGKYLHQLIRGRNNTEGQPVYFIDAPTAVGELWLRGVILGGIVFVQFICVGV